MVLRRVLVSTTVAAIAWIAPILAAAGESELDVDLTPADWQAGHTAERELVPIVDGVLDRWHPSRSTETA